MSYEIGIIGAGIGGACLAQRLKRNGIRVAVFERRDRLAHLARGFWIEINRDGIASLRDCLTSSHFGELMACSRPTADSEGRWLPRALMQQCLLHGLEEVVQFDKTFARYDRTDGKISLSFVDRTSTAVEVLVAADGVHSKVRQQFLPHAKRVETGVFAIGGTAELTTEIIKILPETALEHPMAVNGPNNQQMFIAVWRSLNKSGEFGRGSAEHATADHLMWRFSTLSSAYDLGSAPEMAPRERLRAAALAMTTTWSSNLRRLVELIDPATIFPLSIRTCLPIKRWKTAPITILGDAIHGMVPYGGFGANTAMRDASLLGRLLSAASRGEKPLLDAICEYEVEMLQYGFDATRRSMHILQQVNGLAPMPLS